MENIEQLLFVWAPLAPIIIAPFVTWITQFAKRRGLDPLASLAIISVAVAVGAAAATQLLTTEMIVVWIAFATSVGSIANLIYNVLKKFFPDLKS